MNATLQAQPDAPVPHQTGAPVYDWLATQHSDTAIRARLAAVTPDAWDVYTCDAGDLLSEQERRSIGELVFHAPEDLSYLLRRYDALLRYAAAAHSDNAWQAQQRELDALRSDNIRLATELALSEGRLA